MLLGGSQTQNSQPTYHRGCQTSNSDKSLRPSPESVPLHQRWMEALLAKEVVVSLWLDQRNPRTLDMLQHRAVRDGEYPQLFSGYQVGRRDSFHRGKEQTSAGLLHKHQNHNDAVQGL